MSRIITNNYIEKLNGLINEFESSPKLCSLIDFFLEEIQRDQNRKGNRNQKIFSSKDLDKLNELKNSDKLKRFFAYINIIIQTFPGKFLHIHINTDLLETIYENLITLFIWKALVDSTFDSDYIDNEIIALNIETKRDLNMPYDNNRHSTNQIFRKRHGLKHRLKFIENINSRTNNTSNSGLLLNLNSNAYCHVKLSDFSEFPFPLNTYLNFGNSLQNIYNSNKTVLQTIRTIINLFPAERGHNVWYQDFIKQNIDAWNQLPEFNFEKVITITSGYKTNEALLEMQRQNKFQAHEVYTIFSFEL